MKKNILIIVIVVALIVIAGGIYYWTTPNKTATTAANTAEVQAVLTKLGAHLLLPTGEAPQIGRIDDPAQAVKAQPFVAGAIKGDLLIVYVKAAKAIVYSPSRDLIVNVGPISMNPAAGQSAGGQAPTQNTAPTTPAKTPTKK